MKFLSRPDKIGTLQGTGTDSSAACLKRREDMSNEPNKNMVSLPAQTRNSSESGHSAPDLGCCGSELVDKRQDK